MDLSKVTFRYERKFVVPYLDSRETELAILTNPGLFTEIFHSRQNNNIYFDDLDMTSYFDNTLGNADRTKIRIRWYGELNNALKPVLELKIKRGLVGTKLSFPLQSFSLPCSVDQFENNFISSNLPDWLLEILKTQRATLVNSYTRKYYLSACGKFRITLDTDLTYYGVFNQTKLSLLKPVKEDFTLIEIKYDVAENPDYITNKFPFRMTKSSKYVNGVTYFRGE